MEDPSTWTESSLNTLIREAVTESLTLDYKAALALIPKSDSTKREISKDVSAFANSAGGTVVYGMIEQAHLPVAVDGIDPITVTREWLEQVISSRVNRRIDGVRINQVLLSTGKVVYVVVIPESERAPHMASDHRYYKRFEYQSIPMEEYEVRDVANRAVGPRLNVTVGLTDSVLIFDDGDDLSRPLGIRAVTANESPAPAEYAVFRWLASACLGDVGPPGFMNRNELSLPIPQGSAPERLYSWQLNWSVPGKMPIWNGMNFGLFDEPYSVRVPRGPARYVLAWSVKAPRMSSAGDILLLEVNDQSAIQIRPTGVCLPM